MQTLISRPERTPENEGHPRQDSASRIWPWLVLALATLPAFWYVLDFESDIDPEFPRVVRPTFNAYPPPAYRFAEAGDTIDHVAVYVASAAIVLSGWGLLRGPNRRLWLAALAISLAGFWHAATPGPAAGRLARAGLASHVQSRTRRGRSVRRSRRGRRRARR